MYQPRVLRFRFSESNLMAKVITKVSDAEAHWHEAQRRSSALNNLTLSIESMPTVALLPFGRGIPQGDRGVRLDECKDVETGRRKHAGLLS